MKSLGVIETWGLVAAIQAVDAACKAAEVRCIGYRKPGAGLVSVCFEGEISAIYTAMERGTAVVGTGQRVNSLVIARPERCVVEALSTLKGYQPQAAVMVPTISAIPESVAASLPKPKEDLQPDTDPQSQTEPPLVELSNLTGAEVKNPGKKGKKA